MYVLAFDFDGLLHSANIIPIIAIVTGPNIVIIKINPVASFEVALGDVS